MNKKFSLETIEHRIKLNEYMDSSTIEGKDLESSFRFIDFVNRYGGGYKTTIKGLKNALNSWPKSRPIEVLDIGCGIGNMGMIITKWGDAHGFNIKYTGIDKNDWVIRSVRDKQNSHKIEYKVGDLFDAGLPEADFILASMVFHHLTDEDVKKAILHLLKKSRYALIVNDLIRSFQSYACCYILMRFIKDKVLRNDSLLSIKKGFRANEIKVLLDNLNISGHVEEQPWGRLLITILRKKTQDNVKSIVRF